MPNYQRTVRERANAYARARPQALLRFISDTVGDVDRRRGFAIYLRDEDGVRRALPERRVGNAALHGAGGRTGRRRGGARQMKEPIVAEELARRTGCRYDAGPSSLRPGWARVRRRSETSASALIVWTPQRLSGDPDYSPQTSTSAESVAFSTRYHRLYASSVLGASTSESIRRPT